MIPTYKTHVIPYKSRFTPVVVPDSKLKRISSFCFDIIEAKKKEQHHMADPFNEHKRFYNGLCGEAALEEYLGVEFIDYTIGDSILYNKSDLLSLGIKAGIKTVEFGKFPIIFKKPKSCEVIVIKLPTIFVVCGLATIQTQMDHQNDDLILSPYLRERGTKTGFHGFNELIQFKTIEDLKNITKYGNNHFGS